jgi:hypothetical protein
MSRPYPCRSATRQQQTVTPQRSASSHSANQETARFLRTQQFIITSTAAQPLCFQCSPYPHSLTN